MRNSRTGKGWLDEPAKRQRIPSREGDTERAGEGGDGGKRQSAAPPSVELLRFHRGEMTEEQYLDARIVQATMHLRGRISNHKLDRIRATVKRVCQSDPVLIAMKERVLRRPAKSNKR